MKFVKILLCLAMATSSAGCYATDNPFIAAQAKRLQKAISEGLPTGSSVQAAKTFFKKQGLVARYDAAQKTLYAPRNIEPEPKSYLPFGIGLIRSYDIRCHFSGDERLTECLVEPSTKRWN